MTLRKTLLAVCCLVMTLMLFGITFGAGNLRIGITSEATSLDIHATPSTLGYHDLIYATLVTRDINTGEFIPYLAESWQLLEDGHIIEFKLRSDVIFHDGTPFNAAAVKFSFDRLLSEEMGAPGASFAGTMTEIEVVDDYTVRLHYEDVDAPALLNLSTTFMGIISPTAVETLGEDYAQHPVSAGPFKLKEAISGERIVLERNDDYSWAPAFFENQGPSYLETVTFQIVPDDATQLLLLQTNGIDIAGAPPRDILRLIENEELGPDKELDLFTYLSAGINYLGQTSCCGRLTENPEIRKAVAYAINREEIVDAALEGFAEPVTGLFSPSTWGYDPEMTGYPYDPEMSREILRTQGYTDGSDGFMVKDGQALTLVLWTYNQPTSQRVAQIIQAQLADAGINVEIQQLESATLLANTKNAEHDLLSISYGWSDAGILSYFFGSDRLETSNRVHYTDPKVDELLRIGNSTINPEERFAVYQELQRFILDEAPWVPLYATQVLTLVNTEIKGVRVHPFEAGLVYHDAYIGTKD